MTQLNAQTRDAAVKAAVLRRNGLIPAIAYGHNKKNQELSINEREFLKVYKAAGQSTLVDLAIDEKKAVKVLIHDIQVNSVYGNAMHVDFYQVNLKEKLKLMIPLKFIGTSDAVEVEGGIFLEVKDEVEVECLPDSLVADLEVDLSSLKAIGDSLKVSDIIVPEGIEILDEAEEVIASVNEPISEEELAALDEVVEDKVEEVESDTKSGTDTPATEEEETSK